MSYNTFIPLTDLQSYRPRKFRSVIEYLGGNFNEGAKPKC